MPSLIHYWHAKSGVPNARNVPWNPGRWLKDHCMHWWVKKKKERLPGLNLEPTVVHMRSTITRRLLTIDSERLSWIRMYTHCLLCYRSAQWFRGNSVKYGLVLLPSVMQATISMMFTASAPVLYFYNEGFYNVNKMLTRTNFAKLNLFDWAAKFTNPIWFDPLKFRDCTNFFREFRRWTLAAIIRSQQINILISESQWHNERSQARIFSLDLNFSLASLMYACCPCQGTTWDLSFL